ncbi:MAG: twin-arginine translocase TatA/TatE family subunit [Pseudomonadota bacterium]
MGLSVWQILIVVLLLVLLFGRGKISELMGDMAKGIKSFKKGMAEDPDEDPKKVAKGADEPIDVTPAAAPEPAEQKKDSA